ncbi:multiple C2 and transmembrane domain-containing protein 1-like [Watersipora subatra]|uniref:multiple C2 and transmembrane domain-containing protein 1-like n=1 Tax=Watersipora subatra TaxID=2589382 RepID=UPI00355BD397
MDEAGTDSRPTTHSHAAVSNPLRKIKHKFNKLKKSGSVRSRSGIESARNVDDLTDSASLSGLPVDEHPSQKAVYLLANQHVDDAGDSSVCSSLEPDEERFDSMSGFAEPTAGTVHGDEEVISRQDQEVANEAADETVAMHIGGDNTGMRLDLSIMSGTDLIAKDRNGFSDPYVKVRYKNKTVYKTRVISKSLNPIWNEKCSVTIDDPSQPILLLVYDRDTFTEDDFLGRESLDLSTLQRDRPVDQALALRGMDEPVGDPEIWSEQEGSMGQLHIRYVLHTSDSQVVRPPIDQECSADTHYSSFESLVTQIARHTGETTMTSEWDYIVKVALMEGSNLLAMDDNGLSDPYVRFKLQNEKYKTKVKNKTLNPKWMETFSLHLYDNKSWELDIRVFDHNIAGRDDFMGRTSLDLGKFEKDRTHDIYLHLVDQIGVLHLLVTITGAVSSTDHEVSSTARDSISRSYGLFNSVKNFADVGWLQVKVIRAHDLSSKDWGGKSDPFCNVELINTMLQSHTAYSTLNPEWNRVFTMPVKDIHSVLEVTIYDEDKDMKKEFIGKVAIPLILIDNGVQKWYGLKDRKLFNRVKGEVLLELDLVFNHVKAAIRTFNPREERMLQDEPKFKISLFKRNVNRVRAIGASLMAAKDCWQSLVDWHNPTKTLVAFLAFMVAVWNFELYMLPLTLIMLYMWNRVVREIKGSAGDDMVLFEADMEEEGDEEEDDKENKRSFREYIDVVKSICCTIQEILGQIADLGEAIKNSVNWTVPWLSMLAVFALLVIMLILYVIPLRYIVLLWGINKFTKKLRKPNYIPNNEVLDYLSRVPSDVEKMMYREIRADPTRNSPLLKNRKAAKSK